MLTSALLASGCPLTGAAKASRVDIPKITARREGRWVRGTARVMAVHPCRSEELTAPPCRPRFATNPLAKDRPNQLGRQTADTATPRRLGHETPRWLARGNL